MPNGAALALLSAAIGVAAVFVECPASRNHRTRVTIARDGSLRSPVALFSNSEAEFHFPEGDRIDSARIVWRIGTCPRPCDDRAVASESIAVDGAIVRVLVPPLAPDLSYQLDLRTWGSRPTPQGVQAFSDRRLIQARVAAKVPP